MIFIDNRQKKIEYTNDLKVLLDNLIKHILNEEKVKYETEISIILIDNDEIRNLNREYRGIDRTTDVLSFPMLQYPSGKVYKETYFNYEFGDSYFDDGLLVLGDIAISLEKSKEQSEEYGHSFMRETAYLVTHSMLHLLGYDHIDEKEKEIMREREEEILKRFNLERE